MKSLSGDQKQKLFILLGFVGLLVLVGFFALRPSGEDTTVAELPVAAPVPAVGTQPEPAAAPAAATLEPEPPKIAKAPIPVIPAPDRASLPPSRPDPFLPHFVPTLPPEPTPVPIPQPVFIPPPPAVGLPSPSAPGRRPALFWSDCPVHAFRAILHCRGHALLLALRHAAK